MTTKSRKWSPEQRAKFKATMAKLTKAKTIKSKPSKETNHESTETRDEYEDHIIFAHGKVSGWLSFYASSIGVAERDFAHRVGALLQFGKSRKESRS